MLPTLVDRSPATSLLISAHTVADLSLEPCFLTALSNDWSSDAVHFLRSAPLACVISALSGPRYVKFEMRMGPSNLIHTSSHRCHASNACHGTRLLQRPLGVD